MVTVLFVVLILEESPWGKFVTVTLVALPPYVY